MLEKVIDALTKGNDSQESRCFYAEHELNPRDIQIKVEGLGQINFPLNQQDIQKLIALSSQAKFGLRDQTLLDKNIRNTQEISADQLQVTINETTLATLLDKMGKTLEISEGATLIPHLHNMLIYGPDQFFDKHQDSEKLKNMIGTLVIVLPVPHIGGDLIIEHHKQHHIFSSQNIDCTMAKCLAFYADCCHEVKKITQGYRIALTYNLVLEAKEIPSEKHRINHQLISALKDYFSVKKGSDPLKLVYFLDHSYTEHSLRWNMLKGADRINASAFYVAAQELNLIPHLALVEIHETWTAEGDDEEDPEIGELIDDGTTLSYWIGADNQKLSFHSYRISGDVICWTKETGDFEPSETDYQGYMGNYGNTMDYWYRRAAIVLWHESSRIPMNFDLDYEESMKELVAITKSPGQEEKALSVVKKAGKYLLNTKENKINFGVFSDIALYIQDKEVAQFILYHFEWAILDSDIAQTLVKLQNLYGVSWCLDLMERWKQEKRSYSYGKIFILKNINSFIRDFLDCGGDTRLAIFVLNTQMTAIIKDDERLSQSTKPSVLTSILPERMMTITNTLKAGCAVSGFLLNIIVKHILSRPVLYPELNLVDVFLALKDQVSSEQKDDYRLLQFHLEKTIREELALGLRSEDDWSIKTKLPCQCEHCKTALDFLRSKTDIKKVWPLVAMIRDHVMSTFHDLDLPVDLSVEKTGSPHKLIMVKNDKLYKKAKEKFDKLNICYQKLKVIASYIERKNS